MASDPQDINNFINTKGNYPSAIINPDSITVKSRVTYANYYYAQFAFETLDGRHYQTGTNNFNRATKIDLLIDNGGAEGPTNYMIDKPQANALFTFDARLLLVDGTTVDYQFISYVTQSWFDEAITDNSVFNLRRYASKSEVNTPDSDGKYPIFHVFSLNSNLNEFVRGSGFDTNFDKNEALFDENIVSDNVQTIEWKFRSRTKAGDYFAGASFYNVKYSSTYEEATFYSRARKTANLADMIVWIDDVYPNW